MSLPNGAIPYAIIVVMARRNPARTGEELRNALIIVDGPVWQEFKRLMRSQDSCASVDLRRYMARRVRAAKRELNNG